MPSPAQISGRREDVPSGQVSDGQSHRWFSGVWGDAMVPGFQQVPHVLLKNQFRFGLSPLDVLIVLNISMHWWETTNLPYPTMERIAKRIGVSRRSVERRIKAMERQGVLKRLRHETNNKGKKIRRFDLGGLVALVEERARRDPIYDTRKLRAELAAAGSTPAAGLVPNTVQSQERPAASKPAGRVRPVSPKEI